MNTITLLLSRRPLGKLTDVAQPIKPNGMTLLHLAARMYAIARRRDDFAGARYYDDATRQLLDAGADPHALMREPHSMMEQTPASACEGYTPPSLRERMQQEASAGRISTDDMHGKYGCPWFEPYAVRKARRASGR